MISVCSVGDGEFATIFFDITDRKLIEIELKNSENKYRQIVETANEGIWSLDKDFQTTYVNHIMAEMLGYKVDEMIGIKVTSFMFPEDLIDHGNKMQIRQKGLDSKYERRFKKKDGGELWTIVSAKALTDDKNQFAGSFAMFTDITERKKIYEALKNSEALYRLVFENAPIGIMHYDKDGTITDLNEIFAGIIGASKEKIIGFNMPRQLKDIQMIEAIKTALNGKAGYYEGDYLSITAGKVTPSRAIYNPIFSDQGEVIGGVSIFEDITERKRAAEALKQSEERWKFALEGAGDGVWDWNIADKEIYYSHQWKAMLGYIDDEIGDTLDEWDKRVHPDDRQSCYDDLEKHFNGETPFYQNEHRLLCKDGTYKWILDRGKVIQWADDGKPVRVIGTHTDISERKNAETALKEAEEKYRNIFENAVVGMFQTTPEGRYLSANPVFAEIFGYKSAEDLINFITDIGKQIYVNPEDREEFIKLLIEQGEIKNFSAKFYKKNMEVIWGVIDAKVFKDSNGNILYFQGSLVDITEKKKLEESRKQLESQLRQAQKLEAIGTLAGGIAHDFNNILMAILGYTEMSLIETTTESKSKQYLEQVRKASYRAKELVDQILTFSRKQEGERKALEISLIIKEAIKLLRASLPTTIEIIEKINSKGNVIGDPTQMHQILMNLCTNAFHAMPNGGTLELTLEDVEISSMDILDLPLGPYAMLQIKDSGEGIDPSIKDRIFEPYFTTKEVGKGSGLGLAVVTGIVKSHGGAITLDSEPGHGSIFTVYIPKTEVEISKQMEEQSEKIFGKTGRILFVDDEVTIADFVKAALEMMGYEVVISTNSIAAMELFRAQPDRFDLIITDLTMPKLTGVDLAHQLSKIRPDLPIILCTGYTDKFTKEDIKNLGVSDIITKPIGIKDLSTAVQKVLNRTNGNGI